MRTDADLGLRPGDGPGDAPPAALVQHWRAWLGAAPDPGDRPRVTVVASDRRSAPGWDGESHPVAGVVDPTGTAVVSVPPGHDRWARALVADGAGLEQLRRALPERLGRPGHVVYRAVYRWSVGPPPPDDLPPAGRWLPVTDSRVPEWLRPFGGSALVVLGEDDEYLAGVGLKRHDAAVHEIAVGTDEAARGRGLARRLVAQAARELLSAGIVPTYMHDPANAPSARVADAAGFPDRGWSALGIADVEQGG